MGNELIPTSLSVYVYGELEQYNELISKARVRIFYKGPNRNGTYISEEFAEKLISSLPYSPIKGIFDDEIHDFIDHGTDRTQGRAYGVVPNPTNFAWEKHLDDDGVEREYACADVLLWTGLYEEAKLIPGKAQSMELYSKTLQGDWRIIEGQKYYYFTDGSFLGLQALGESVEPCFEGSAFYSLLSSVYTLRQDINDIKKLFFLQQPSKEEQGDNAMNLNFKLSDSAKHDALWTLLNPNFTEESGYVVSYAVLDVFDDYAIAYNYESGEYERVYYTKDDATDSLTISKKKKCYILDITEEEKNTLDTVRALNGDTYEKLDEKIGSIDELNNTITSNQETIEQLNSSYAALEQEKNTIEAELNTLREFKDAADTDRKNQLIEKYSARLDDEIIDKYKNNLDKYSILDLEKDLSYELVNSVPEIFTKKENIPIPKDDGPKDGIEGILSKYV